MSKEIIIAAWGAIGDCIVCTPVFRALKETYPDRKIILYARETRQAEVFKHNPYIDSLRILKLKYAWRYPFHVYAYLFNRKLVKYTVLSFQHVPLLSSIYKKNVKDVILEIFNIQQKNTKSELYLTEKEEEKARIILAPYKNVVILHVQSMASVNNMWYVDRWEQLVKALPEYTFVQVGHTSEPYIKGAVDVRGKTTLREAFALLKYADSFAGVNSSFSHASNAFGTPGVVVWGPVDPLHWGHDNNINLYKQVSCAPCYYYIWKQPCPYGHECMKEITVNEVKEALMQQMNASRQTKLSMVTNDTFN